jgi:hypothetical protein
VNCLWFGLYSRDKIKREDIQMSNPKESTMAASFASKLMADQFDYPEVPEEPQPSFRERLAKMLPKGVFSIKLSSATINLPEVSKAREG